MAGDINVSGVITDTDNLFSIKKSDGAAVLSVTATGLTAGSIANGFISNAMLADDAVTAAKIAPGTIVDTDIADDAVTTAKILDANVTTAKIASSVPLGTKNRIINGNMAIDQRNAGAASTPGNNIYTLDRWNAGLSQGSKYSVQQVVDAPDGLYNSIKITVLATATLGATDYFMLKQKIEGHNVADFNFGTSQVSTITVSFWVKSTVTGTFGGSVQNSSEARGYAFNYAISSANTWEKKSVTLTGDTTGTWDKTTGTGLWLNLALGVGTTYSKTVGSWVAGPVLSATGATNLLATGSATIQFTGVQLEKGDTATPFENLQYGQQLALCQRYFERYNGAFDGGIPQGIALVDSANRPEINLFYLEKRANPTISGNTAVLFSTMANTELTTTGGPYSYVGTGPRGTNLFYNVASGVAPNTLSGVGYIKLSDATDYINIDAEL